MPVVRENVRVNGRAGGNGAIPEEPGTGGKETVRELVGDRALDLLLARSKDEAGQLRLTGEGSMPGELVRAVLERDSWRARWPPPNNRIMSRQTDEHERRA